MPRKISTARRSRNITSVEWTAEYAETFALVVAMSEDPLNPLPVAECIRQLVQLAFLGREHIYAKNIEDERRKIDRQERFTLLKYVIQNNMMLREKAQMTDEQLEDMSHDSELFAAKFLRAGDGLELAADTLKKERLRTVGITSPEAE